MTTCQFGCRLYSHRAKSYTCISKMRADCIYHRRQSKTRVANCNTLLPSLEGVGVGFLNRYDRWILHLISFDLIFIPWLTMGRICWWSRKWLLSSHHHHLALDIEHMIFIIARVIIEHFRNYRSSVDVKTDTGWRIRLFIQINAFRLEIDRFQPSLFRENLYDISWIPYEP